MVRARFILILLLLSISFVYAEVQVGFDDTTFGVVIDRPPIEFNNKTAFVNMSDYWVTDIGILGTVNATEFNNEGGTLTIDKPWFTALVNVLIDNRVTQSFIQALGFYNITESDDRFVNVDGDTMTGDLALSNAAINNTNYVQFNTSYANGQAEGKLQWNMDDGTLEVGMPGGEVNLQIGQEMLIRARNTEGETITNCQAVWVSGATGGIVEIMTPIASNVSQAPLTFGLATENILDNQLGYVTLTGLVRGCDTSAWSAGDVLYLSETEEGNLTNVSPEAPNTKVIIGIVTRSQQDEGIIATNPTVVQRIALASDVYPNARTNNSILAYNATSERHEYTTTPFFNGITMNGTLNMDGNSIDNIFELMAQDGSAIAFGNNPIYDSFSGLDQAIVISTNQSLAAGEITHTFLDTFNNRVIAAWQSGKNDSGAYERNSRGNFPDLGITNASILTNMEQMWFNFGISPLADYFSAGNRTAVASLYAFESQKLFLHDDIGQGELLGEGQFTWVARDNTDIEMFNGDGVHIKRDVVKEFGFSIGDNITSLNADFESGTLSPFVQTTGGGIVDWTLVDDILCHDGECARALGGSGSPLRSMQTNFSSIDQDNLNLSFWLTTVQAPSDVFTVEVNNNVGSGDVEVFSSSSAFVDEYQSIILPASMNDKSTVTVIFNFQGNNINNDVAYIDEVLVIGNATTTTLANVTVQDGLLSFGNKECGILLSAEDGYQDLNISCDNINLIGNVTAVSVTEVSINVTENVDVGGNLTVGGDANITGTIYGDGSNLNVNNSEYLDGYDSSFFTPLNKTLTGQYDFNGGWTSDGLSIINGDIYAQTGYFYNLTGLDVTTLKINGSLLPMTGFDNQFDLGSSSLRWRDLYLGGEVRSNGTGDNWFLGNVGIGITNPQRPLHIQTSDNIPLLVESTDSINNILMQDADNAVSIRQIGDKIGFADSATGVYMIMANETSKNVGIGTDEPDTILEIEDVQNAASQLTLTNNRQDLTNVPIFDIAGRNAAADVAKIRFYRGVASSSGFLTFETYKSGGSLTEKMRIDTSGNVGIGTVSPLYKLQVDGGDIKLDNNEQLLIADSGATVRNLATLSSSDVYRFGSNIYSNLSSGNVGIGTDSPLGKLHVVDGTASGQTPNANADGLIIDSNAGTGLSILTANNDVGRIFFGDTDDATEGRIQYDHTIMDMSFWVEDAERMTIDKDGNVGIGTTSPGRKLEIENSGSTDSQLRLSSLVGNGISQNELIGGIDFYSNDPDEQGISAQIKTNSPSGSIHSVGSIPGDISFLTVPTGSTTLAEAMRIDNAGNVGIGTSSPTNSIGSGTALNLVTSGDTFPIFTIERENGVSKTDLKWSTFIGSTGNYHLRQDTALVDVLVIEPNALTNTLYLDAGGVGIGTTNPVGKLDVSGDSADIFLRQSDGKYSAGIQSASGGQGILNLWLDNADADTADAKVSFSAIANDDNWINNGGNVGIGTSSPDALLEVRKDASGDEGGVVRITNGAVGATGAATVLEFVTGGSARLGSIVHELTAAASRDLVFSSWNGSVNAEILRMEGATGNVGIGTSSPTSRFQILNNKATDFVAGETDVTGLFEESVAGVKSTLIFKAVADNTATGNRGAIMFDAGGTASTSDNKLILSAEVESTLREDLVILGNGRVGIGTNAPNNILQVVGGNIQIDDSSDIWWGSNTVAFIRGTSGASGNMTFGTNGASRMFINASGDIGIGTSTPVGKLNVVGDLNVTENLFSDRIFLGNNASIGYNATCAFIFYNQTGSIIETKGCM